MSKQNYTTSDTHKLLTVKDAARYLGIHPDTLRKWTNEGKFPCIRFSEEGYRYFDRNDIKKFLKNRRSK